MLLLGGRWTRGLLALQMLLIGHAALGDGIAFTKVADTGTSIPGGGTFTGFSFFPAVSGNWVSFEGPGSQPGDGIYRWNAGVITTIANTATPIPNGTGTFLRFNSFSQDGGNTFFNGYNSATIGGQTQAGVYLSSGGTITPLLDMSTVFNRSDGSGTNKIISPLVVSTNAGSYAVNATTNDGFQAVVSNVAGSPAPFADFYSSVPGTTGQAFSSFGPPVLRNGNLAFIGQYVNATTHTGATTGVFTGSASSPVSTLIANKDTPIPGGSGTFGSSFGTFVGSDGAHVSFVAGGSAVYLYNDSTGVLSNPINSNTLIPGTANHFGSIADVTAMDNGMIVFAGSPSGLIANSIYLWNNGAVSPILSIGETFDTKIISGLAFGPESLKDSELAVKVNFSDGSQGIFVATVPEPTVGLALLSGLTTLARRPTRKFRLGDCNRCTRNQSSR